MLVNEEALLQELSRVLTHADYDGVSVVEALESIKAREKSRRSEKQRQAVEMAMNATYRIAQVRRVKIHDHQTGALKQEYRVIAGYIVARRDVPAFAREHGLDAALLIRAIENRASHASNKQGDLFHLYPKMYSEPVDRTEELEDDAREAAREIAYIHTTNAGREQGRKDSTNMPAFLPFKSGIH